MSLTAYAELASWKPPQASLDQAVDIDSAHDPVPVQATLSELIESGDGKTGRREDFEKYLAAVPHAASLETDRLE